MPGIRDVTLIPKQPFMVELSSNYYKYVVNAFGISHFYSFFVKDTDTISISVPDGCIDMMIHYNKSRTCVGADFYGTDLLPHSMKVFKGCTHFGVRFLPGYVPAFVDASMPEMIDRIIPFPEIAKGHDLPAIVAEQDQFMDQISAFMQFYLKYYEKSVYDPYRTKFGLIAEIVKAYGNIRVEELSERTNYSVSYIDKIFLHEIGISPKSFSSILRFQWTLNKMVVSPEKRVDYNSIIADLGYYDQSHFIREFKKYSKYTPSKYIAELFHKDYNNRLVILTTPNRTAST